MSKKPELTRKHKVCVICEGLEEKYYFSRLLELNVFSSEYEFIPINADGATNVFARFQDAYNNDTYEIVLVFCDTDKSPHKRYLQQIKEKITRFFDKKSAAQKLIIWANPCSMQIILSHFGEVHLVTQAKKANKEEIEKLTGVKNYGGHEKQIKIICEKIYQRTYPIMKERLNSEVYDDKLAGTSNIVSFLELFELNDIRWISETNKYLEG